jgi:hypothetical protein
VACNVGFFMMENEASERPAVSCSDWLDGGRGFTMRVEQWNSGRKGAFAFKKNRDFTISV